jgi:uncharacterized membrane protein
VLAVRYLHLLAMAFFVGVQLVLVAAVVPTLRDEPDRERLRAIARRFGWGTLAAVAVLVGTASSWRPISTRWDSGTLQIKLGLVVAVAGLVVWHMRRPHWHALEGAIFAASLVIVWLGASLAH